MSRPVPSLPLRVGVIGSGVSGLSAAWLLSSRHEVVLYESASRLGGHANTVDVEIGGRTIAIDTGFIVYNEPAYPNLTALFSHLGVETAPSDMSFAVSLDGGRLEYNGTDLKGLFARRRNVVSLRFWAMLRDLLRFYREAPALAGSSAGLTLGELLEQGGYGRALRDDHLLPMAAAIWSAPPRILLDYPAEAFIRFCQNHGLLQASDRPQWRTVAGGSRTYVRRLAEALGDVVRLGSPVGQVVRHADGVEIVDGTGNQDRFDAVVIATHADTALSLLADPSEDEAALLGAFRYAENRALLHDDPRVMPRRRRAWASWNYAGPQGSARDADHLSVTYWMNSLQPLPTDRDLFVTLNPTTELRPGAVLHSETYDHPIFDRAALDAQARLWSLQGERNTWYCGAHFGSGFHEDGLQSGLAVAEQLGGVRRPWNVANESGRIPLLPAVPSLAA